MSAKSYVLWERTKAFAEANPGKKVWIVTPRGHFEIVFKKTKPIVVEGLAVKTGPRP